MNIALAKFHSQLSDLCYAMGKPGGKVDRETTRASMGFNLRLVKYSLGEDHRYRWVFGLSFFAGCEVLKYHVGT